MNTSLYYPPKMGTVWKCLPTAKMIPPGFFGNINVGTVAANLDVVVVIYFPFKRIEIPVTGDGAGLIVCPITQEQGQYFNWADSGYYHVTVEDATTRENLDFVATGLNTNCVFLKAAYESCDATQAADFTLEVYTPQKNCGCGS